MKLWEVYNSIFEGLTEEEINSDLIQNQLTNLENINRMLIPEEFKFNSELNNFILVYDAGIASKPKIGTYTAAVVFTLQPEKNRIIINFEKIKTGKEDYISAIPNRVTDEMDEMGLLYFKTEKDLKGFLVALKSTFGGDHDIIFREGIPT